MRIAPLCRKCLREDRESPASSQRVIACASTIYSNAKARAQARIILMPPRRIVDAAKGPQPGIFQTAQAQIPCARRDSIGGQPCGGAGDWQSSPRSKKARAVIREGAGSHCICVGLTSMCAGSRWMQLADHDPETHLGYRSICFPQVDRRACSMWQRNSARSRRFRARPWRDAALDE